MHPSITKLEDKQRKTKVAQVESGDTIRVHQLIREGNKQRVQIFEGVVIRTDRQDSITSSITVRRIASGIGVEKTFLLHSPNVSKVEVIRRAKVRRNYLSYLRQRRGKSARLQEVGFDRATVNAADVPGEDDAEDAEVTEIDPKETEQVEVDTSTEQVANEETKEAAADEPKPSDGGADQGDESVAEAEEAESGVDRAEPNKQP